MTPSRFAARRLVIDDATLTVRQIRPDDRDALRAAFHKLSPESRYRRFQGHVSDLSPAMLRYLTEVDGSDHFAVVAVLERRGGAPLLPFASFVRRRASAELVGVARLIKLPSNMAEVAITVADAFQGRGLGAELMEILVKQARKSGIDTLVAHVLSNNEPMMRLLRTAGPVRSLGDGAVAATLARRDTRAIDRGRRRRLRALRVGRVNFVLAMRWLRSQRRSA